MARRLEGTFVADRSAPTWLQPKACVALATTSLILSLAALWLTPPLPPDSQQRKYVEWLKLMGGVVQICGRQIETNPECWARHPLPPDPTGTWGRKE